MALETLKDVEEIDGFKVVRERGDLTWDEFDEKRKAFPINITDDKNMISFRIQDGPVKEYGVNGCQVDTLVATAAKMIEGLNGKFPSKYNANALFHLEAATLALKQRKLDREARGVEGRSQA